MLKAVYYTNQFFAGIGGEDKADIGLFSLDEAKGPAVGLDGLWKGDMKVVRTIYCGDNYVNVDARFDEIKESLLEKVKEADADVFVAGPAFNAGRYGVACAKVSALVKEKLGLPVVTAMWHENPAVSLYQDQVTILSSTETAAGMRASLPALAAFAMKLAKGEKIGSAAQEGYFPTGRRYNEYVEKIGGVRVVDMLLDKLNDRPYKTEIPLRESASVTPASPIANLKEATIALITTGGLVPKGNPDSLKQAFSVAHGKYALDDSVALDSAHFESIHGGYDTTYASAEPNRLIPYDALHEALEEGQIKSIFPYFLTTCGIGTNVKSSRLIGQAMIKDLQEGQVSGAILTTT
jgi:glycine reductase